MAFTLETPLGTLLDLPQAKAIIEQYAPGVANHPMVPMVKGMTLNQLVAMPQAAQMGITKEKVESILVEVNKVIK